MLYPLSYEDNAHSILPYGAVCDDMSIEHQSLPFFVYGTLLPGQPNFGYWLNGIRSQQPAILPGARLYDQVFYPILNEEPGGMVRGLVITVETTIYPVVLNNLDFLEGYDPHQPEKAEYRRERRVVELLNGRPVVAWVYIGQPDRIRGLPPVGCDWKRYAQDKQGEIESWWQDGGSVYSRSSRE